MRDVKKQICYKGKTYDLVFNLNVMEVIQDEYGTLERWMELTSGEMTTSDGETIKAEPRARDVIFGIAAMLNEGIDMRNEENGTNEPLLTRKQVGRVLSDMGMANMLQTMQETVVLSTENGEKNA